VREAGIHSAINCSLAFLFKGSVFEYNSRQFYLQEHVFETFLFHKLYILLIQNMI
jgi:hypothetical protein